MGFVHVWLLFGSCLIHVWFLFDSCLIHVWFLFDSCLVHIESIPFNDGEANDLFNDFFQ